MYIEDEKARTLTLTFNKFSSSHKWAILQEYCVFWPIWGCFAWSSLVKIIFFVFLTNYSVKIKKTEQEHVKLLKKMIFTSERQAKHPFVGWNTQHKLMQRLCVNYKAQLASKKFKDIFIKQKKKSVFKESFTWTIYSTFTRHHWFIRKLYVDDTKLTPDD